jgi:hypothetical protein
MTKTLLVATIVMASFGTASAGGQAGSVGVGAEYQLEAALGGLSVNYDAGKLHAGGYLGFNDPEGGNNTDVVVGARFFFHVASTAMSDFSVGGSLGIHSHYEGAPANRQTDLFLEPAFQIRAFISSNVALSFTGGISIGTIDASEVRITGQATGIAGVHYYFF